MHRYPPPLNFQNQTGNALFLILIVVALFAALSYAITQSGRGSGNISKEQKELKAAQLMAYMASIQTAVTRMTLSGTSPADLQFNTAPLSGVPCTTGVNCVFAPEGGGVIFQDWQNFFTSVYHNKLYFYAAGDGAYVENVGTTTGDEVMVVIAGIGKDGSKEDWALCDVINKRLGLPLLASLTPNQPFDIDSPPVVFDSIPGKTGGCFRDEVGHDHYGFYWVFYPG